MSDIQTVQRAIGMHEGKLNPQSFEDLQRMANMMLSTGMLPQGCDNLPKAILLVTKAFELGIPFSQVSSGMMIVRNKPAVWGDTALGLVTRSPECAGLEETIEGDGEKMIATCRVVRVKLCVDGQYARIPTVRTFSVDDAKAAKLWKKAGPWMDYPKRMLSMRARAFAIRDSFPDLLNGLSFAEEVIDYPEDAKTTEATRAADITHKIENLAVESKPVFDPESDAPVQVDDGGVFSQMGLAITQSGGVK